MDFRGVDAIFRLESELDRAMHTSQIFTEHSPMATAIDRATATMEFVNPNRMYADLAAAFTPTASLVQQFAPTGISQAVDAAGVTQALDIANLPQAHDTSALYRQLGSGHHPLSQFVDTVNVADAAGISSWKPILMRQSWLPE